MNESRALELDQKDPLKDLRQEFMFPEAPAGREAVYLCGNSLGLQPKKVRERVLIELEDWGRLAVEGHFHGRHPWLPYHELLAAPTARLVGAKPEEVVVMNSLTVNLHLMMVSFYRPTSKRFKILIEGGAFPSDQYAVASQARFHGFDPAKTIVELKPRVGEVTLRTDDILATIRREGPELALVMLGGVNYLTGQAFDLPSITREAHAVGAVAGFDLAHAAGNLALKLHDSGADFAVWCSYKYLNAGPGAIAGCFVHERHLAGGDLPRFAGWWGHDKASRFAMPSQFRPIPTAEGWQLSNPPILQLAALAASMDVFDRAGQGSKTGIQRLREKSLALTAYLEELLISRMGDAIEILTPRDPASRGCQLSLKLKRGDPRATLKRLVDQGVYCDFREPDVIRIAPTPLYNRFIDAHRFVDALASLGGGHE